ATPLRFNPAADFNGTAPTLVAHLADASGPALVNGATVDLSAVGSTGGSTRYSTDTVTLSQDVLPVNDAPTLTGLQGDLVTFTEGGPRVLIDVGSDALIADIDSANFDGGRSEEHTSELQSRENLVCRLLL